MKSILFVIDSLGCGGAEKSLVSLLPLLNRDKYEIHLWVLHRGGVFESLLPDNVILDDSPSYTRYESLSLRLAFLCHSLYSRVLKLLNIKEHGAENLWKCVGKTYKVPSQKYNVAIAYQQGFPTYLVATKIKAQKKFAWINADIFKAGYNTKFNRQFYDRIDYIVPVSNDLETLLCKNYPQYSNKYHCVYDIINPQIIRKQASEDIAEQAEFDKEVILVTTGRLARPKNHLLAVDAAKILKDRGLDFRWFFVGEGGERQNIENKIKEYGLQEYVRLLGLRTNPYPYMARCLVYVQTSSFEGFGMTIAEAKILGKPVVSTNFDVVYDQLEHERNGLISQMEANSLAENIMRMVSDETLRKRIIEQVKKETNDTCLTEAQKVEKLIDED